VFTSEQINQIHGSSWSVPAAQREAYFRRIIALLGHGNVAFTNFQLMQAIQQAQKELRSGKGPLVSAA
jgi:hypothetical protein